MLSVGCGLLPSILPLSAQLFLYVCESLNPWLIVTESSPGSDKLYCILWNIYCLSPDLIVV